MKFEVVTDIKKCAELWRMFHTEEDWWDLWELRECFIVEGNNKLYFIVGYENEKVVGVLPLCLNEEQDCYVPVGYLFPERNKFLLKDKTQIPIFLEQLPEKVYFCCIDQNETQFYPFKYFGDSYFLNLTQFETMENYLQTFSKKHRDNVLYDMRKMLNAGYKVKITDKEEGALDVISKFNIERFGKESSFIEIGHKESMANVIRLAEKKGILQMISVVKDDEIVGAEFGVIYNGNYLVQIGGSDPKISNLGKILIYKHIENSINMKAKKLDFMGGGDSWKKLWNFSKEPIYEYGKNVN